MAEESPHCTCPACGAEVAIEPGASILQCPACNHQFFLKLSDEEIEAEAAAPGPTDEPQLDALRIRQRTTMVRSAYRSRSYAIIATIVCTVLAVQSSIFAIHRFRAHSSPLAFLYLVFCLAGAWGAIFFFRNALSLHREARKPSLDEPTAPPDFSDLGDGSDRVRKLEEMQ
jgi:DNA-directed RNA polymerase subunit RPC12/RpoP